MPSLQCERSAILLCGLGLALANALYAQSVGRQGDEFSLSGPRRGDQMAPHVSVGPAGGFVVWQDDLIDGPGKSFGIAARRLNEQLVPVPPTFRVNQIVNWPQENPQVTLLKSGGASFVWQGGKLGAQDIYFRTLNAAGTMIPATDLRVNAFTAGQQSSARITCLPSGNLAVAWCSLHQDKSLEGVYARIVKPNGQFVTAPFRVNQSTGSNQRSPAMTALSNGQFVVVWASDNQGVSTLEMIRHTNRVHLYGRVFGPGGAASGNEFRINTRSNACATPSVAAWGTGGFTVTWAERTGSTNGCQIYARTFSASDTPVTDAVLVNDGVDRKRFGPKIASVGSDQLIVWTAPDGWREGVAGRFLRDGQVNGPEFVVNTQIAGSQVQPVVATDKTNRFLVAWSSFIGDSLFDIEGQRYLVSSPATTPSTNGAELVVTQDTASQNVGTGTSPPLPPTTGGTVGGIPGRGGLRVSLDNTVKGRQISWNTEIGKVYQVQYSTNCSDWKNLGDPRSATATFDSTLIGNGERAAFYRVIGLP